MNTRRLSVITLGAAISLAACNGGTGVRNETGGALVGGALGGLLGSQVGSGTGQLAATAAGVLAGAFLGSRVGKSMDETDKLKTAQALETAPTGRTTSWANPDSGERYAVTPTRTYNSGGQPCRDYTTEAWIDGQRETVTGTACRQPDGTWRTI